MAGCGAWGRNLVRTFSTLGSLSAVYDPDPAAMQRMVAEFGAPARSLGAILDDPTIDAVVVAAPAAQHDELAMLVLEAGKHVFVEKPLALRVDRAQAVCDFAEDRGLVLMVGHLLQYHPAFEALEQLVAGGGVGRLQYLYSNRLNFGRIRREENILWSFAHHDISMMLRLARSEPDGVSAVGSTFLHTAIADVTTTHLSFPNGVRGHVFVSWLHPFKEQKLVVIGDRGMAVFDDGAPWESKLRHYPHQVAWRDGIPEAARANAVPIEVEPAEPLRRECEHFLSCIRTGSTPRTDGREAVRVLKVLDAAEKSMRPGTEPRPSFVADPPAQGVFIHETAVVDDGCVIGAGTKVWHFSHILKGSRIGRGCVLGQNVMVGPDVTIGNGCRIQNNVSVYKGVTLEDNVFCGPSSVFTNVLIPRAEVDRRDEFLPTLVQTGATIGANATIVCGNTIGSYSVVAAGAVVTHDVASHSLVAGVPARHIGWVSHDGVRMGPDLVCPRTGKRYRLASGGGLEEVSTQTSQEIALLDLGAQRARLGNRIDQAVTRVVEHQQFILGPEVHEFEDRLSAYCGATHTVSCASGTDALMLAVLAQRVRPGDAVLLPSFTFTATAEVVSLLGATPVFIDVEEESANIDPTRLDEALRAASQEGLSPVGIIAVDLFGRPADYAALGAIAEENNLWLLGDAAQSLGASVDGALVGTLAPATATSFFPSKPLGCYGDGGAVLTSDEQLATTIRSLALHGRGSHKYEAVRVGLNSRLDTIQAAVLLQKLELLEDEIKQRRLVAEYYSKELGDIVGVPAMPAHINSAWAAYTIRVSGRDDVQAALKREGIQAAIYYPKALHQQPAYKNCLVPPGGLPVTETLVREVLSLPIHPYLPASDQERVVRSIRAALGR
ncbi:MAG TPA: aminotransferase class I/II-fold pyridoxal phosphate-dependent enzyme [Actinomycetota bacterium]|nr:aminotransferase class I/II-fold pyridoxal phosphate-dependent enzyme [Actinomycetota bacterium]